MTVSRVAFVEPISRVRPRKPTGPADYGVPRLIRPLCGVTSRPFLDYHLHMTLPHGKSAEGSLVHLKACGSVLALLLFALGSLPVRAQPPAVERIANYAGADRHTMLETGAKREGGLLLYTTGTQIKPLIDRFEAKYPYLRIALARASAADTARKVLEEYRAGFEKVDAFELASPGLVLPRDEGILQPFRSPEFAAFASDAVEPGRHWVVVRESYT